MGYFSNQDIERQDQNIESIADYNSTQQKPAPSKEDIIAYICEKDPTQSYSSLKDLPITILQNRKKKIELESDKKILCYLRSKKVRRTYEYDALEEDDLSKTESLGH